MGYEKELKHLKKDLNNAQNNHDEAEEDECESDAEMWMNRIAHLEFQIEVFKKAAKADEYEAKAKAFDEIVEKYEGIIKEVRNRKFKVTSDVTLLGLKVEKVIQKYESGEPNELRE